ncbi:MAG: cell envelope integrity protein TolA, partial [Kiritimatiellae bacterium]|nr:cell envelope integrity protein TolA [Kiritimatiellia bacterium]
MKRISMLAAAALCAALCRPLSAADAAADAAKDAKTDAAKAGAEAARLAEVRAQRMVKGAVNLFEQKENERAIGMLEAVQRM